MANACPTIIVEYIRAAVSAGQPHLRARRAACRGNYQMVKPVLRRTAVCVRVLRAQGAFELCFACCGVGAFPERT